MAHPSLESVYPVTIKFLKEYFIDSWQHITFELFPSFLSDLCQKAALPAFLPELAAIEAARYQVAQQNIFVTENVATRQVNPTLEMVPVTRQGLTGFFSGQDATLTEGTAFVLLWLHPEKKTISMREATPLDLLALKIVTENISLQRAAAAGNTTVGALDSLLFQAASEGLILKPPAKIRRGEDFPRGKDIDNTFFSSPVFTLQWHLTQACDLSCRHCYDRSNRKTQGLGEAYRIFDSLFSFCQQHHVYGQVTFTGGNPFLYSHFFEVYQRAAEMGFLTAVLGNPVTAEQLDRMAAIQRPEFYQISIEGLQKHNDYIRGDGHFDRSLAFLALLKQKNIYSMVMLTLTKDNMDQVLPLAAILEDQVDLFTFNRLAAVGEGAALRPVPCDSYPAFLASYLEASNGSQTMGLKDNLLNILCADGKRKIFGGCAGFGCGAAFNFVSLLPDGEVHACRKFPSPIGHISSHSFSQIYHSEKAKKYRQGAAECHSCRIRPVCGGCLAVSWASGQDIFIQKDPYCFIV